MAVTTRFLISRWSGFLPIAMSLLALTVVIIALATGTTEQSDEGTFTHLWQLLMAGQLPIAGWFVVRWAPLAPRPSLVVVGGQLGAALLAAMPVLLMHL